MIATEAAFDQPAEPPVATGVAGAVRSSLTVAAAVCVAGVHADVLPATSTLRSCTHVLASAETVSLGPLVAALHVVPPSVEVRYWYPERPEPPVSVEPLAVTVAEAAVDQAAEPPATVGAEGAVRSSLTVACVHGEASADPVDGREPHERRALRRDRRARSRRGRRPRAAAVGGGLVLVAR